MKSLIGKFAIVLIAMHILGSCAPNNSDSLSDRQVLEKIATVVSDFTLAKDLSISTPKNKSNRFDESSPKFATDASNIVERTYTTENGTSTQRIDYYLGDGITPIDSKTAETLDTHVMKVSSNFESTRYRSNGEWTSKVEYITSDKGLRYSQTTSEGKGKIDYFLDSVVVECDKIKVRSSVFELYIKYDLSFFSHQYFVTLEQTIDIQKLLQSGQTTITLAQMTGDIVNSNNRIIGRFVLDSDGSVTILDDKDEIVKTAG